MGYSCRTFLLDRGDALHRLAETHFWRMLREPGALRLPQFAGERVRMASVVVALRNRRPVLAARTTFSILTFDQAGCLVVEAFDLHQRARLDLALAPVLADTRQHEKLVDATSRFVAQGGSWTPSRSLARAIEEAALGRRTVPTLRPVSASRDPPRH